MAFITLRIKSLFDATWLAGEPWRDPGWKHRRVDAQGMLPPVAAVIDGLRAAA